MCTSFKKCPDAVDRKLSKLVMLVGTTASQSWGVRRKISDTASGCCMWHGYSYAVGLEPQSALGKKLVTDSEGPGWAATPPSPLLAVPNVTAHPSPASVPSSYYLMWHYNYLCPLNG